MPNRAKFDLVCSELERGVPLNLKMVGDIFGNEFWELFCLCLVDAKVAVKELKSELGK